MGQSGGLLDGRSKAGCSRPCRASIAAAGRSQLAKEAVRHGLRTKRSKVPLIVGLLLLVVVAYLVWRYVGGSQAADTNAPAVVDSAAR